MDANDTQTLIIDNVAVYGYAVLSIIGAILVISIGYLVFRYGWKLVCDQSLEIGGYYLRKTPYKGYNRFRSKAWNMKHTA